MEKGYDMYVNMPPANTYGWLRANKTALPDVRMGLAPELAAEIPDGVSAWEESVPVHAGMKTGAGPDVGALLERAGTAAHVYTVPEGEKPADALRLHFTFDDTGEAYDPTGKEKSAATGAAAAVCLELGAGSELTVVMDHASEDGAAGLACVQTKAVVGANAVLRLVQLQRLGEDFTLLNDIGGRCAEGGRVELIRLVLGGKNTYDGCSVALEGDKSALEIDIGYRVGGDGRLDMNYESIHTGKKTECAIRAAGVLSDRAFKLFRGTIDLRRGCSGSVGNEVEDVLLMDETVRNQTIPVILCAEEDVVGNHGATIGRLDEDLIFYLESRGMERERVYDMMARARVDAVIRKIPDEKTRRALFPELSNGEDGI